MVREVSLDIIVEDVVELVDVWSVVEEVVVVVVEFRNLPRVCFAGAAVEAVVVEAAAVEDVVDAAAVFADVVAVVVVAAVPEPWPHY